MMIQSLIIPNFQNPYSPFSFKPTKEIWKSADSAASSAASSNAKNEGELNDKLRAALPPLVAEATEPDGSICYDNVIEKLPDELKARLKESQNSSDRDYELPGLVYVSAADIEHRKIQRLTNAANDILLAIRNFENEATDIEQFFGGHVWSDRHGSFSIDDIRERLDSTKQILCWIGASPDFAVKASPAKGRPVELWHRTGRNICRLIRATMESIGYSKSVAETNENSITAIIATEAVNWAYNLSITAAGLAKAMQRDNIAKG